MLPKLSRPPSWSWLVVRWGALVSSPESRAKRRVIAIIASASPIVVRVERILSNSALI
jgi:hypothetical protein